MELLQNGNLLCGSLERLEDAGYSILRCENRNLGWYMTDHEFEDYEVKMLVDAVAAAKFLTIDDSRRLIGHIRTTLATQEGGTAHRCYYGYGFGN